MKDAYKQRSRIIKACLAATIIISGILLIGCDNGWSPASDESWIVGDCEIHEKIEVTRNTWPDAVFKRSYWLIRSGVRLSIGTYQNESSVGMVKEPFAVDDCIVIPSSCYVYRVEPNNGISVFDPFKADQWWGFAEPRGINGHYDYHVDTVRKMEGTWKLSYVLESGLNGVRPTVIHFVSKDNWQSFQIETNENEQGK
ncbi:MAG: hypothetical protein ACI87E_002922 [Mariniblastus sp.]|jgi:hypothetical protein